MLYSTSKKKKRKKRKVHKVSTTLVLLSFLLGFPILFYLIYFLMFFYFSHGFLLNTCLDIHKANNTMGNYIYTPVHIAENLTQRKLNTIAFKPPPYSVTHFKF